jgi:hypothetical protein
VLGVQGEAATAQRLPQGVEELEALQSQDFVLLSHRTFFARDVRELTLLRSVLEGEGVQKALRLAVYFLRRPRDAGILARTKLCRTDHPLDITYHSATPYLFGDDLAVKYSLRPRLFCRDSFCANPPDRSDPDYLRKALQESLHPDHGEPIELELCVHYARDNSLPVEDARADWERHGAAPYPVASIVIRPQNFSTPELLERCERIVFNPWNSLLAHKPLGSLNRARFAAYRASVERRSDPKEAPCCVDARGSAREQIDDAPTAGLEERVPGPPPMTAAKSLDAERRPPPVDARGSAREQIDARGSAREQNSA